MNYYSKSHYQKPFLPLLLHHLFYTMIFAVVIAIFFTLILNKPFGDSLIMSSCISLSVCLCVITGFRSLKPNNRVSVIIIIIIGDILGITLGALLGFFIIGVDLSLVIKTKFFLQFSLVAVSQLFLRNLR